jgi:hypothetical protein
MDFSIHTQISHTNWTDVKDKFRIYRRDIADTLNSPYYVLHNDMILLLLQDIKMELLRQETMEYNEQV